MSPRLKSLLLWLAILAAAGLWRVKSGADGGHTADSGAHSSTDARPAEVIRQGVKGSRRVLTPGQRHRYTFDLDTRTAEDTEAGRRTAHTGWGGELALTYLGTEGGQHLFQGQFVLSRVEAETRETPMLGDAARRGLVAMFERPVYVAQDSRGRVLAVHFDAAQDVTARRFVRSLLASTQFVAEDGPHWSTEEADTTGDFESEYRAGGSANAYTKTKRRYLRVSAPLPGVPTVSIGASVPSRGAATDPDPSSGSAPSPGTTPASAQASAPSPGPTSSPGASAASAPTPGAQPRSAPTQSPSPAVPRLRGHLAFTLFADGHVKEAAGSDVVEMGMEGRHVRVETRVALTSVGVDHQPLSLSDFQSVRASLRAERLAEREPAETPAPSEDRKLVGNAKPDELMKRLARATRPEARAAVRARLAALFRLEPAEADRAAGLVRGGEVSAALSEQLVESLVSAGTREAQQALASVLVDARVRPQTLEHTARLAARVERPAVELAEALDRVVDGARDEDVRNTAALAVGSVVKGLEPMEPGGSQALLERMLRRCHARTVRPVVCLRMLANAGAPGGLAYTKSALLHPAPMVRGTATEALRSMPGAEVDVLLDQVLLGDPSPRVRALAVAAISQRIAGAHLRAVATALRTESSEQVRLELVRLLGGWKTGDEAAAALLRDVADNDASERVRRLASSVLAG